MNLLELPSNTCYRISRVSTNRLYRQNITIIFRILHHVFVHILHRHYENITHFYHSRPMYDIELSILINYVL